MSFLKSENLDGPPHFPDATVFDTITAAAPFCVSVTCVSMCQATVRSLGEHSQYPCQATHVDGHLPRMEYVLHHGRRACRVL